MLNHENANKLLDALCSKDSTYINDYQKYCGFTPQPFGLNFSKDNALFFEGLTDNVLFFLNYYSHFANICLSRYAWDFDKEKYSAISADFIEKMLFFRGSCAIINDENGLKCCDYTVVKNKYNSMFEPLEINAIDYTNGTTLGTFSSEDFVIVKNNFLAYPTNLTVMRFCAMMSNLDIATKINTFSQQIPILLQGTEKQRKTLEELAAKMELGNRYIFAPLESDLSKAISSLDIREPFIAKDLIDVKNQCINQLLTLLGINNENVNKQSGITSDEVNANNAFVKISSDIYSLQREKTIEELKEKFDFDVKIIDNYAKILNVENSVESVENSESEVDI